MGLIINPSLITNDTPYNYRNKITLKVVNGVVGYYKLNSHSVVEVNKCLLAEECINDVISIVCGMGIINGEVIIRSNYKSEILIIINSKDKINTTNILIFFSIKYPSNLFIVPLISLIFSTFFLCNWWGPAPGLICIGDLLDI